MASPAYLDMHGVPRHPDDLVRHAVVHYASPSTGRIEPWEWSEEGRARTRMMRGQVVVNNAEAYIACCLAGLGLIQVPVYDVRHHLARGELIEVLAEYRAASMPITLLYPHRQHVSSRLRAFMEWLDALLRREVLV